MAFDLPSDADDEALVVAMAGGNRAALAILYDRYAALLLGLAIGVVRERRAAEDLLHDVFLEAWRGARDFDARRGRVRTWLIIRMRARALDRQRSAHVSRNTGDAGLDLRVDKTGVDKTEEASHDHGRIRSALGELGQDQRRVLELAYFEGLSCTEIATRVGIPVGTARSRIATGLERLRLGLGADAQRTEKS